MGRLNFGKKSRKGQFFIAESKVPCLKLPRTDLFRVSHTYSSDRLDNKKRQEAFLSRA